MDQHSLDGDLVLIYNEIMAATHPSDVFGPPDTNLITLSEQRSALRQRFISLRRSISPNQYSRIIDVNAATDAITMLDELYKQARSALDDSANMNFTVRGSNYQVGEQIATGEHSVLHRATVARGQTQQEVVIKIATNQKNSERLKTEAEYLRQFHTTNGRDPIARVKRTLPALVDTFNVDGRQVNVLPYLDGYKNLREIVEHFDHQLPVAHGAWIARRVLALPITALMAGLQHNAITPQHVLVHPITHEPIYLGWGHATKSENKNSVSDLRMTGDTMWYLFGNPAQQTWNTDVPPAIADMVHAMSVGSVQASMMDPAQVFADFTQLVHSELGNRYRPLNLN